jgi:hypothetical protein
MSFCEKCKKEHDEHEKCDDRKKRHDRDRDRDHKHDDCHHEKCCRKNDWIKKALVCFMDSRVVFFTKDATHTEGTVREIHDDFIIVVPTQGLGTEPVEVESNDSGISLERFIKYHIRIDDIVGFGQETLGD